ncbi:MAG: hypothetical protein GXO74_07395 [Calditrichaeota bacterium]|nr:hypothetical protein [Calditrichota bacterium]
MKRATQLLFALFFILSLSSVLSGKDETIFEQRRQKILQSMPENSLLILAATPECYRFGFNFHQNSDLFYLTGNRNEAVIESWTPGIYIPENSELPKEYWNIGVGIEDGILITENGHRLLARGLIKSVDDIGKLMAEKSILEKFTAKKQSNKSQARAF